MALNRLSSLKCCFRSSIRVSGLSSHFSIEDPRSSNKNHIIFHQVPFLNLSSSACLQNDKRRKMVKNKNLKNNPDKLDELKKLKNKARSHIDKFDKGSKANRTVTVWDKMTMSELSEQADLHLDDLFEMVFSLTDVETDYLQSEHQQINNKKLITALAKKLHFHTAYVSSESRKIKVVVDKDVRKSPPPEESDLVSRPPVVTIMGHIDHGKTSLLDFLRKSRIVAGEHGGITQHIGAFSVSLKSEDKIVTFIDTPGHAAFTAMRARGAGATDVVILIVDACEGVLEQTRESLRIIRQARVPFVVAINKIDKPGADIDIVKEQLASEGVRLEERDGDVQCVPISALKGTNVNMLIEAVLTQAELMDLKCDVKGKPEGVVIESQVEQGLGKTATVLLQRGILRPSGHLVSGLSWCRVRLLLDDQGNKVKELRPSQAAKVVGWKETVPSAGMEVLGVESDSQAREVISWRQQQNMKEQGELQSQAIADNRGAEREAYLEQRRMKRESGYFKPRYGTMDWYVRRKETEAESETPVVSVLIKGDVDGSVEAILSCLDTYQSTEVKLDLINFGIGQVSESDINLAQNFDGIIYAFNTTLPDNLYKLATSANVPVRTFNVIYHLIDDLKMEISSKLPLRDVEEIVGRATVLQEFLINQKKDKLVVAGCRVVSGRIPRDGMVRVSRGQKVLHEGTLASLKHLKEEVSEIAMNQEGGLRLSEEVGGTDQVRFESGDQIVSFTVREEQQMSDWNPGF